VQRTGRIVLARDVELVAAAHPDPDEEIEVGRVLANGHGRGRRLPG
jgi:hypothetical protein